MTLLLPMTIAGLLVTGMGLALLGSIKVSLARRLEIDEARVGGLISMFGFAMIPVILAVGFLTDELNRQVLLASGGVLMVVSLGLLAVASTYRGALLAVLLFSASWSAQINVINVLTPLVFTGGSPARAFNLANFIFGMGAFLTPLAAAFLLRRVAFTKMLFVLAGAVLVSSLLAMSADFSPLELPAGEKVAVSVLLGDPLMWLCALALFFYGPIEAAVAAWATTYFSEKGIDEASANRWLSGFWLTFMFSRLITAFALSAGHEATLILVMALACAGILLGVAFTRSRTTALALVVGLGLVFGPIFPTILAILLGHFEPAVHGRAVGLFFALGGIGWTTVPMLMGAYARRTSVQRSFLIAVGLAVGLSVIAIVLVSRA